MIKREEEINQDQNTKSKNKKDKINKDVQSHEQNYDGNKNKVIVNFIEEVLDLKKYCFTESVINSSSRMSSVIKEQSEVSSKKSVSDLTNVLIKLKSFTKEEFTKDISSIILTKFNETEETAEIFAHLFHEIIDIIIDQNFIDENLENIKLKTKSLNESTQNSNELKEKEKEKEKPKPKRATKGSRFQEANQSFISNEQNFQKILLIKSSITSRTFYEVFDEEILNYSPFETRRNPTALKILEQFKDYFPSHFQKKPLYDQNFLEPSFFDFIILPSNNLENFNDVIEYFKTRGMFYKAKGIPSILYLESLMEVDKYFLPVSQVGDTDKTINKNFFLLLDFITWIKKNDIKKKNESNVLKNSEKIDNKLGIGVKLKNNTSAKNIFNINNYGESPFYCLYKVNILLFS